MDGRREGGEVGGGFSLLVESIKYANIAWPSCHLTKIPPGQAKLCMRQSSYACSHRNPRLYYRMKDMSMSSHTIYKWTSLAPLNN